MISENDKKNLIGVKQSLVDFAIELDKRIAVDGRDLNISEGVRTLERQKILFKEKKSKTLKSKHLTGDAIDVYPIMNGKIDYSYYPTLVKIGKEIAKERCLSLTWGNDWLTFKDSPHIELK